MDFDLTGDQKLIQESIREFLQKECPYERAKELEEAERGYDPGLWRKMAELGYLGIAFPEEYGGTGGSFIELMIIAEELGKAACPSPFFSTVIQCGLLILEAGAEEQKRDLLRGIASGNLILALAQYEEDGSYLPSSVNVKAERDGRQLALNGTKMFVKDANIADRLVVVAKGPNPASLCLVGAGEPGVAISQNTHDRCDNTCEVIFRNVQIDMDAIVVQVGNEALQKQP